MKFPSDTTVLGAKVLLYWFMINTPGTIKNTEHEARRDCFFLIFPEKEILQNKFNLGRGVINNMQAGTKLDDSLGPTVSLHFVFL